MTEYDEDEVTSWAALADEFEDSAKQANAAAHAEAQNGNLDQFHLGRCSGRREAYARIRHLIPRLGDPNGPPKVGDLIAGNKVDRCVVGTLLRGDHYGAAAIRTVNGWQVTGMSAAQGVIFVTHNMWKVVEVPEPGRKTS